MTGDEIASSPNIKPNQSPLWQMGQPPKGSKGPKAELGMPELGAVVLNVVVCDVGVYT